MLTLKFAVTPPCRWCEELVARGERAVWFWLPHALCSRTPVERLTALPFSMPRAASSFQCLAYATPPRHAFVTTVVGFKKNGDLALSVHTAVFARALAAVNAAFAFRCRSGLRIQPRYQQRTAHAVLPSPRARALRSVRLAMRSHKPAPPAPLQRCCQRARCAGRRSAMPGMTTRYCAFSNGKTDRLFSIARVPRAL